jgi:hypothetical protein
MLAALPQVLDCGVGWRMAAPAWPLHPCRAIALAAALLMSAVSSARADYTTILDNGPSSNRVDIVFMGDGYTASELDVYHAHVNGMINDMFNANGIVQPFPRYVNFFNVHYIDVISQESGADDAAAGHFVDTALDAGYGSYINETKADAALSNGLQGALSADIKFVAVNSERFSSSARNYAAYGLAGDSTTDIALHELGHAWVHLADEYTIFADTYSGPEPAEVNVTTDPSGAKWGRWLGYDDPVTGVIGAYEGGRYYEHGIYRPSISSRMNNNLDVPFDAVSREAIILEIYRKVDPLDGWLDNSMELTDPVKLWVDSIDPAIIQHQWYVDGAVIPGVTGEEFNPLEFGFGPGTHEVSALNFDPTDWVRSNYDLLQQEIVWTVNYTVPEVTSYLLLFGMLCFCSALRKLRQAHGHRLRPWAY